MAAAKKTTGTGTPKRKTAAQKKKEQEAEQAQAATPSDKEPGQPAKAATSPEKEVTEKLFHKDFEKLKTYANATIGGYKIPVNMTGEAGVSKTFSCMQLAEELGVPFFYISGSRQLSKSDVLGFKSPDGRYIDSQLGEAYTQPCVFVLEEADAVDTNVMMNVNTALSSGKGFFGGRMLDRHPDFIFISTSNTYNGGDSKYNARQKHDASTMSRFTKLPWNLDEKLEQGIIGHTQLAEYIGKVRVELNKRDYDLFMRDALNFKGLLDAGIEFKEAAESTIFREVSSEKVVDELVEMYGNKQPDSEELEIEWVD